MRWLWSDPHNSVEASQRRETLWRIDEWWRAFAQRAPEIDRHFTGGAEWDLPHWMHENLQTIDRELMWEFGPAVSGDGHRLVITPESSRWLRPMVDTILERAPKFDGWEFYAYRVPESLEWARRTIEGRTGFVLTTARVEVTTSDHRVHLRFLLPECSSEDDEKSTHAAFVATESLLGEQMLDEWIGAIDVAPLPKRSLFSFGSRPALTGVDISELKSEVERQIAALRSALPDVPCIDLPDDWQWTMWKLKPPQQDDYDAQEDLFVGKSGLPPMWMAAHRDTTFASSCFSRHGETFCYVKMDGSEGLDEEHFADKGEIEDALDEALKRNRSGCCIGGGTGYQYSYIDLALLDVKTGIETVQSVLREGNSNKRSWVLFFDSVLAEEWVGVWPDTPPPPTNERTAA